MKNYYSRGIKGLTVLLMIITKSAFSQIITLGNGTIPAGNIYQTATNHVLYRADVAVGVTPATLNSAVFTTAGSYLSANLSNLKLWYSENSAFSAGSSTLLSTKTTGLGAGAKTFSGLSQVFPVGTGYLFLTTDVPCNTTLGNSLNVSALTLGDLSFVSGSKSTSGFTSGGTQLISALTLNAVSSKTVCAGKNISAVSFVTLPSGLSTSWTNDNPAIGLATSGSGNISSYAAPSVTSNQTGNITVTPSNGACVGTGVSFSILVKSNGQSNSVWTGAASADWNDADNWSNCNCTSLTDATIAAVSSPSFNPVINAGATVKNLVINSGAVLSIQNLQAITLHGNWSNNGSFNTSDGAVIFNGSSPQTIGGTSKTSFYDLVLNNVSGASLSSQQEIRGTLLLSNGVFNTNNQLTLAASSVASGKIGPIAATADIINNVTIEQYAPGGSTGWALLGSPLSSALTMADLNDDFTITCASCPDGYFNFTSVYSYNESMPGDYSASAKYTPITSISDPFNSGRGYWAYLGNGSSNTSAITIDVTGNVAKSNCLSCSTTVNIPLSFTSNNGAENDGWNLISNPLPSPISWTALRNGNVTVEDAIYVYNADLNGGLGGYTSYVNGVSGDISGGIGDNIGMFQGFYVHATAAATLIAGENIKTDSNPALLSPVAKPTFRLLMDAPGFNDMTTFYFEKGGSPAFQPSFDAYKLDFGSYAYIGGMSDSILTSINGLPELPLNSDAFVKVITTSTGTFTFSSLQQNFPENVCVSLYDRFTGTTTNILKDSYVCTLYDTTATARFKITFYTTPSLGITSLNQPHCAAPNAGIISAKGTGSGPWNYEWSIDGMVIKTSLKNSGSDSLLQVNGGVYSLKIISAGGCEHFSETFTVNAVVVPTASFSADTYTTTLAHPSQVNFSNQSTGSQLNAWTFGDNSGTWYIPQPSYKYQAAGIYTVTLVSESITHCKDTLQKVIKVIDDATGISGSLKTEGIRLATLNQGNYELLLSPAEPSVVDIKILALNGVTLKSEKLQNVSSMNYPVDLSLLASGMYLLNVGVNGSVSTFKLLK